MAKVLDVSSSLWSQFSVIEVTPKSSEHIETIQVHLYKSLQPTQRLRKADFVDFFCIPQSRTPCKPGNEAALIFSNFLH